MPLLPRALNINRQWNTTNRTHLAIKSHTEQHNLTIYERSNKDRHDANKKIGKQQTLLKPWRLMIAQNRMLRYKLKAHYETHVCAPSLEYLAAIVFVEFVITVCKEMS